MLMRECEAIYSGSGLITKIYHGPDLVYYSAPEIKAVSMTLSSRTCLKFTVASNGTNMDDVSIRITYPDDESDASTEYSVDGNFYIFHHNIAAHRIPEPIKIELLHNGTVIQAKNEWTVAGYLNELIAVNPDNEPLADLAEAILNYGAYAAYFNDPTGQAPNISVVERVTKDDLLPYKAKFNKSNSAFGVTCGLNITDTCDIVLKFNESAWEGHNLLIDGVEVDVTIADGKVSHRIIEIMPRDWGELFNIQITDADGKIAVDIEYSVLSYAYNVVGLPQFPSLSGLMKAMFLYNRAIINAEGCI